MIPLSWHNHSASPSAPNFIYKTIIIADQPIDLQGEQAIKYKLVQITIGIRTGNVYKQNVTAQVQYLI
jgi:hypothetical protein